MGCVCNLVIPEPSWRWTRVSCHRLTARKVRKITASLLSQTNIFLHWSWLRESFDRDWIKSSLQTIRPPNLFYARAKNPRRLLTTEPLISAECFLCPIILQRQKPASIPPCCNTVLCTHFDWTKYKQEKKSKRRLCAVTFDNFIYSPHERYGKTLYTTVRPYKAWLNVQR